MNFSLNKTPIEIIKEGDTYFRNIYSRINEKWCKKFMERICSAKKILMPNFIHQIIMM